MVTVISLLGVASVPVISGVLLNVLSGASIKPALKDTTCNAPVVSAPGVEATIPASPGCNF